VLETPNFDTSACWYMDTLGFIPSDVMCLPDGTPVGAFMRLDRGHEPHRTRAARADGLPHGRQGPRPRMVRSTGAGRPDLRPVR
jgi:hypothetical protein